MSWFLRAKHWQIFLLIFAVPVVLEIIGMALVFATRDPAPVFVVFALMMAVVVTVQFGWFYNVGVALGKKLPENAGMNLRRFRSFALVPAFYLGALMLGMIIFGWYVFETHEPPSPALAALLVIIIPLHFFSIFCIFYSIWFIAKSLKMVERWNRVELGDYIGDFFLIWFLFIGIWFIQPRINRLFDPTLPPTPPQPNAYNPNYPPGYPNYPQQ